MEQVNAIYVQIPLEPKDHKYLLVINTLYEQQKQMYHNHSIENRIVSIQQPHVRPIVRSKSHVKVEFGAKIHVSLIDGISFLDELSWEAFNERKRIKLLAKPLGRPSAVSIHLSPRERNPIEGKFGQAKTGYGLNRFRARLWRTSETWIASIILVFNLVKLAGLDILSLLSTLSSSFSAMRMLFGRIAFRIEKLSICLYVYVILEVPVMDRSFAKSRRYYVLSERRSFSVDPK